MTSLTFSSRMVKFELHRQHIISRKLMTSPLSTSDEHSLRRSLLESSMTPQPSLALKTKVGINTTLLAASLGFKVRLSLPVEYKLTI